MALTATALVLLSAVLHVAWNLLVKSSADPRAFMAVKGIPFLALGAGALIWIPLDALPPALWACVILSGLLHTGYVIALSNAYTVGDLSLVYPIARSAPAFIPIAAYFILGERISLATGAGIAVVVVCILVLQLSTAGGSLGKGWRALFNPGSFARNVWAYVTLASVVAYSLTDKSGMDLFRGVESIDGLLRAPIYFVLENALCYGLYWSWISIRGGVEVRQVLRTEWKFALLAALGTLVSYSLILYVFETESVSTVVALRQSSVLVAVVAGWLWLGEPAGRLRLLASAALFAGLTLVAVAS